MIDNLFEWKKARLKQREAPLLNERERYLLALLTQGVCKARVRTVASMLLHIIRLMQLDQMRPINRDEILDAGQRWLTDVESHTTRQPGKTSVYAFRNSIALVLVSLGETPELEAKSFLTSLHAGPFGASSYLETLGLLIPPAIL